MRLINVTTYELHDYVSENKPEYAILSHTWGDEEVSFLEMQAPTPATKRKTGFRKIEYTCRKARNSGIEWAWVDTCCIDKSSSAELSEAINSMYLWYKESKICYVYLADLEDPGSGTSVGKAQMLHCRWFTRGWCLQELLAPDDFAFFSKGWVELQQDDAFCSAVANITGIESKFLERQEHFRDASVAARMSWAANRECTRVEDIAYCLLGIFDVHMPLLYGEGKRAFLRLQEEIWKEHDDHSLLAWSVTEDDPRAWATASVFAESPNDFRFSGQVTPMELDTGEPSTITHKGMGLDVPTYELVFPFAPPPGSQRVCEMALNCTERGRRLSMLTTGDWFTFTRIATLSHFSEGGFSTSRASQAITKPKGRMVHVKKIVNQSSWQWLDVPVGLAMIELRGLSFGTVNTWLHLRLQRPWNRLVGSTKPLDLDTVRKNWPATTHCVYAIGEIPKTSVEKPATVVSMVAAPDSPGPSCFQLLLAGNVTREGQPREKSLELRCGIKIDSPITSLNGKNSKPMVCLDLLPWDDEEKKPAGMEFVDGKTYEMLKKENNDSLLSWAKDALRPAEAETGDVARASAWWGGEVMHVVMHLVDKSTTGDHFAYLAPHMVFTFQHSA